MASLKDINATIEEGNEDLQKLNQNFASWLNMQRTSGDDLEAKAEKRTAKKKGGFGRIFKGDFKSKGNKGLFGTGLGLKGILGLTALIAPIIFDLFKDEIAKYLRNILGKPGKSLSELIEEYLRNALDRPVTNLPRQIKIPNVKPKFNAMRLPPVVIPKTTPNIPLNQNPRNPTLDSRGRPIFGISPSIPGTVNPNAPTRMNPYTNPSKGIYNNAYLNPKTQRFESVPKNLQRPMGQSPGAMGGRAMGVSPGAMGGGRNFMAMARQRSLTKILNAFNPRNGNTGNTGHWFTRCVDAIAKYVPRWIKVFLERTLKFALGTGMKLLFIFEIILILCDHRFDILTLSVVPQKYTLVEKAVKIAAIPSALYISSLGAVIGGIVGTATLGPIYGTAIGAVVGGIIGYASAYTVIMILLEFYKGGDYSARAFGKLLEKHLGGRQSERLTSELQAARNRKMGKAKLRNSNSQTAFSQAAMSMRGVDMMVSSGNMSVADGFMRKNSMLTNVEKQFYDAAGNTTPFLKEQRQKLLGQIPGPLLGPLLGNIVSQKTAGGSTLNSSMDLSSAMANGIPNFQSAMLNSSGAQMGVPENGGTRVISTGNIGDQQHFKTVTMIESGRDFSHKDDAAPWMPLSNFTSVRSS